MADAFTCTTFLHLFTCTANTACQHELGPMGNCSLAQQALDTAKCLAQSVHACMQAWKAPQKCQAVFLTPGCRQRRSVSVYCCRRDGSADRQLSVQAWGAPQMHLETLQQAYYGRCPCTSAARCSCSCCSWAASRLSGPRTGCSANVGASHHSRECLQTKSKALEVPAD